MKVCIEKSDELMQLLDELKMEMVDLNHGIVTFTISKDNPNPSRSINEVVSKIEEDNQSLTASCVSGVVINPDGSYGANVVFLSLADIAFIMKDPGHYMYTHGLSHVCPPFR